MKILRSKEKSARKFKINYMNKRITHFAVPPYTGEFYDDMVPDTLDIQERIKLAVNGLTGPTDPKKDHLMYGEVNFRSNPPVMRHNKGDICQVKFMEALPLMRLASGSNLNNDVDPAWMALALRQIGSDGLFYWPAFPWAKYRRFCRLGEQSPNCFDDFMLARAHQRVEELLLAHTFGVPEKLPKKSTVGLKKCNLVR